MKNFCKKNIVKSKGFSLIELLVVIGIIALLSTISIVAFSSINTQEKDTRRTTDMKKIMLALERYRTVYGKYPECFGNQVCDFYKNGDWYTCLGEALKPYIGKIPVDPTSRMNKSYCYRIGEDDSGNTVTLQYFLDKYVDPKTVGADSYYSPADGIYIYYITVQPAVKP